MGDCSKFKPIILRMFDNAFVRMRFDLRDQESPWFLVQALIMNEGEDILAHIDKTLDPDKVYKMEMVSEFEVNSSDGVKTISMGSDAIPFDRQLELIYERACQIDADMEESDEFCQIIRLMEVRFHFVQYDMSRI